MLSESEIQKFKIEGFIKLESAFARKDALAVQDFIWGKLKDYVGVLREDRKTWQEEIAHIKEDYSNEILDACSTSKLNSVISQLISPNEWADANTRTAWGWWPVNFSYGIDKEWTVPHEGWHWDGLKVKHSMTSPDMGLLLICLFSDVKHKGGATMLATGSHLLALNFLKNHPEITELTSCVKKCIAQYDWLQKLTTNYFETTQERNSYFIDSSFPFKGTRLQVVEAIGNAGDVYLCHPYLFHAASYNHLQEPRFMCNRTTPLKRPHIFENNLTPSVLEQISIGILESDLNDQSKRCISV